MPTVMTEVTNSSPLFLAVDLGTSGARAVAVTLEGTVEAEVRRPYPTHTPRPGFAEQDARDWERAAIDALTALPAEVKKRIAAIGLTGQCPTVAPFDEGGRPVRLGMMYRDNRAVAEAAEMRDRLGVEHVHHRTGHTPEPFHIAPKVLWMRRHEPDLFGATSVFLQPRDVVLRLLTGETLTDESHADATLFFDLRARSWAPDLFDAFDVDPRLFPQAVPPWTVAGELEVDVGLPTGIPVVIGAGDSQCAAFGAGVTGTGLVSEMAGSSSCLNSVVSEPLADPAVSHYSHVVPGLYTTEMGVNTSGAAVAWAVEQLGYREYAALEADAERFAAGQHSGSARDVAPLFLPYLGDGDRDNPQLRASFANLSLRHDRSALAYSVLEGVALAVGRELDVLAAAGSPTEELRVSGGGARLPLLGRLKANLLDRPVVHLEADATAVGVALLAATSAGYGDEAKRGIAAMVDRAQRFEPDPERREQTAERARLFEGELMRA